MGKVETPDSEDGSGMICIERNRQIAKWGHEHDESHDDGALASNAALLLSESSIDPWQIAEKHPDRIEQLIIAGALVAAEIDRLLAQST